MKEASGALGSIWALGISGLQGVWQSKLVWLAVGFSVVHVALRAAWIFFVSILAPNQVGTALNANFLSDTVALQAGIPLVIVLATVGSRVTARDRMMGGLEFILSKAIPSWGYVLGRITAPLVAAALLVFLPAVLLSLLLLLLVDPLPVGSGDLLWGMVGMAFWMSVALGPLAAGVGTLVDNPRSATGFWLALAWLTIPLANMADAFDASWWWLVSPTVAATETTSTLLGQSFPAGSEVWQGWAYLLIGLALALGLLHHRTREVVR